MANVAKEKLSSKEYIAAIWARKALAYDLLDDAMFRQQFGASIPPGFGREAQSEEMKLLAAVKAAKQRIEAFGITVAAIVGDNHQGVQNALGRYYPLKLQSPPPHVPLGLRKRTPLARQLDVPLTRCSYCYRTWMTHL